MGEFDPRALKQDVERGWLAFHDGPICAFIKECLKQRHAQLHLALENVSLEELKVMQGAVKEVRRFLVLLESTNIENSLNGVVTQLEKIAYGR